MRVPSLSLSLALAVGVASQATPQAPFELAPYSARVQVVVSSSDEVRDGELCSRAKSFLTRDLRELRDITVDDSDPDWSRELIAMQPSVAGRVTGYALSYTLRAPLVRGATLTFSELPTGLPEEVSSLFQRAAVALSHYRDHQLMLGPMESLKRTCEGIVADFDAKHLEPARQETDSFHRRMRDAWKQIELKKKPRP
jgi:hypothetical protein